jgi:hypothetical protein
LILRQQADEASGWAKTGTKNAVLTRQQTANSAFHLLPLMIVWSWPTGGGRLSQLLAPNRPVRSGLEWQQSGVDLAYLLLRH